MCDVLPSVRVLLGVLGTCALVATAGCAGATSQRELADMNRKLDAYRRQSERDRKHIDELENRVYVLEDKVETQSVSQGKGDGEPRLPVVKKSPPPEDAPAAGGGTVHERYTDDEGDEVLVIYEGDAARKAPGARPKIQLHEGSREGDMIPVDEAPAARQAPKARRPQQKPPKAVAQAGGEDRLPVQKDVPPPPGDAPSAADDPLTLYKASYQALTRREHAAAIAGFQRFLELWPDHDYADNAQYWLGESFYDQRDYQTALVEFRKVVKRYPDGNKAPDALLKIGYCYAKLGDLDSARDVLSQVIEIYPKTEAAKLATRRLEEMRP
jgi:tol-pal system protein YbgF